MQIVVILIQIILFAKKSSSWEYCQSDIQTKLCGKEKHFACDSEISISEQLSVSKTFLAHVPLTRKVKASFLNWHNYYRNRTAGGWAKNKENIFYPKAARMRELIWDNELSYLAHMRTKLVSEVEETCCNTQRFPFVAENLIVKGANAPKPVLEIIALSLRKMFDKKNPIDDPVEMPKKFLESHQNAKQFATIVNDRVSRVGCAVALGADCEKKEKSYKFCYYTACTYDENNEGVVYKTGKKPAVRCSRWETGRSKSYVNLCANSGKMFGRDN